MRTLHLFAGAGGGLLADLILGYEPVAAVEWDPYCCQVLRERRDDGWFPELEVVEGDIREFDASEYAGRVACVSGGFPCTDVSVAGKGAGLDGERSGLWSEFARVLRQVRPRFAFIENSPALVARGLDRVLSDLAALGFDAEWAVVSAADVGASHLRERIWILADADNSGRERSVRAREQDKEGKERKAPCRKSVRSDRRHWTPGPSEVGLIPIETDDVACRVDQLKAIGNGQVPLQAAMAYTILSRGLAA